MPSRMKNEISGIKLEQETCSAAISEVECWTGMAGNIRVKEYFLRGAVL